MSGDPVSIGAYRIIARLGGGGMATVYRALQTGLQREVALKVVAAQYAADPRFCERFLREARAGAMINHANVITCYDAGKVDGQLYMAMELVSGGDLEQLLHKRGGVLEETLALTLIQDAAAGLEAIEGAGLVHRDIKPANIFVTDQGVAKLADLGLVHFADDAQMTAPGTVMGTPAYIAPEQAHGVTDIDIRADIYALGATLFHLVTGKPPFHADTAIATLMQVLNDPLPDPRTLRPGLSGDITAVIRHACAKDRAQRYACARHLREDLMCAIEGRTLRHARSAGHSTESFRRPPDGSASPQRPTDTIRRQISDAALPRPTGTIHRPGSTEPNRRPTTEAALDAQPPTTRAHRGAATEVTRAIGKRTPASDVLEGTGRYTTSPTPRSTPPLIDPEQLRVLTRRILVDRQHLTAALVLAPGASFPRILLDSLLGALGITYGLIHGSINDATRPSDLPRRIVLARGDAPSPGFPGMSIYGERLPPLDDRLVILVADDAMSAAALTQINALITREDLEPVLKASGIRFGLDLGALRQLVDGPVPTNGRLVIARGKPSEPGDLGGFTLSGSVTATSIDDVASAHLTQVKTGAILGTWRAGREGAPGMDVLGRPLPCPSWKPLTPEECAGEGTELGRNASGELVLRATRNGLCQRQLTGVMRVVGAVEINGDLGPDSPPIETNDIVVIRGNVMAGAVINSASDVVVLGDVEDATIIAGGSVEVLGGIAAGQQTIMAGETIAAGGVAMRRLMAGSLRISGVVSHAELLASGDIDCDRVVGGTITAGGNLGLNSAGDHDGIATELWAGRNLSYADQTELVRLAERRHAAERDRLLADVQALDRNLSEAERKNAMLQSSRYVRKDALQRMENRRIDIARNQQLAAQAAENSRRELARLRSLASDLKGLGNNDHAALNVRVVAHPGTVLRLADIEPERLSAPRLQARMG
jgi:serine/threonine-protein kinase